MCARDAARTASRLPRAKAAPASKNHACHEIDAFSRRFLSWRIYHMLARAAMQRDPTSMNFRSDFARLSQVCCTASRTCRCRPATTGTSPRRGSGRRPVRPLRKPRRSRVVHNREANLLFTAPRRATAVRSQKRRHPFGDAGPCSALLPAPPRPTVFIATPRSRRSLMIPLPLCTGLSGRNAGLNLRASRGAIPTA